MGYFLMQFYLPLPLLHTCGQTVGASPLQLCLSHSYENETIFVSNI